MSAIATARNAATAALLERGWTRWPGSSNYQPVFLSPDANRCVQLVRILGTPRFEVAPVTLPTDASPVPERLDYEVVRCGDCGAPVTAASVDDAGAVLLDAGYTSHGRYRLTPAKPGDARVAVSDGAWEYGHTLHVCRVASRLSGRAVA